LGLGAVAALPITRMLERSAFGDGTFPMRYLGIYSPHGTVLDFWRPQSVNSETDFSLTFANSILQPLERHKKKILILDGLDYKAAAEKGHTGHDAIASALTGQSASPNGDPRSPTASIDQVIADHMAAQPGGKTKLRSIEVSVHDTSGNSGLGTPFYGANGLRLPTVNNPAAVYRRLFSGVAPQGDPAAARRQNRRKTVLDFVSGDIGRLRSRLGKTERDKLDAHAAALSDLEQRISVAVSCSPGNPPSIGKDEYYENVYSNYINNIPALSTLMTGLIAQAFACDITRVVSLQHYAGGNMPWLGFNFDVHPGIAHRIDADGDEGVARRLDMAKLQRWYAEQVAQLLDALDAIPEGNGTVLDHTIVYWANELSNGSQHDGKNVPLLVAGGGGKFRVGRYLKFATDKTCTPEPVNQGGYPAKCPGMVAHNGLLVSILNAFGIAGDTFGDPDYKGALPNLT